MKKFLLVLFFFLTACGSEISVLSSGAGVVAGGSVAVKAYKGADLITVLKTKKSIGQHVNESIKKHALKKKMLKNYIFHNVCKNYYLSIKVNTYVF